MTTTMEDSVPDLVADSYTDSEEDGDDWEECMEDSTMDNCVCLFCSENRTSAQEIFKHCKSEHKFDIWWLADKLHLDCFSYIKMVNFIRQTKPDSTNLMKAADEGSQAWQSDEYMKPVLEDDGLLQFDIEEIVDSTEAQESKSNCTPGDEEGKTVTLDSIEHKNLLHRLHEAETRAKLAEDQLQHAVKDLHTMRSAAKDLFINQETTLPSAEKSIELLQDDEDGAYFSSYGHFNIHQEMLQDKVRTESYMSAICDDPELFRDKVVLDVGCGTGILCMFAARAGAKLVIGVEMSDIIYQAMDIVRENGLEGKVKLVKGRMEDVDLPVEKVDIIISEWMGYFLLFESMLDTVLWARDHYLEEGGILLPDRCSISLVALNDPDMHHNNYTFWKDVYGFKMSCMQTCVMTEANVVTVNSNQVISEPCVITELDLCHCSTKDLEFTSPFKLPIQKEGNVTFIVAYFDIYFTKACQQVSFSTNPAHTPTHWKQTVFMLDQPIPVMPGDIVDGQLVCMKNKRDPRSLKIRLSLKNKIYNYVMQ